MVVVFVNMFFVCLLNITEINSDTIVLQMFYSQLDNDIVIMSVFSRTFAYILLQMMSGSKVEALLNEKQLELDESELERKFKSIIRDAQRVADSSDKNHKKHVS